MTKSNVDFPSLWKNIEEILASPDNEGGWLTSLLPLVLELSGLSWAFITEIYSGETEHYAILAECPQVPALETLQSYKSGLAGIVHAKLQPLAFPNLNAKSELSAIFHQNDPLKKATSFYGWPMIYNQTAWGGLLLAGTKGQTLDPEILRIMECLALRLAAQIQQEKLMGRVSELNVLDSQTGLPHRCHFLERLERQIEIADVRKQELILTIMGISGLGRHSISHGKQATLILLRSLSLLLLQHAKDSWEIGHVSYGVFAISLPLKEEEDLDKASIMLKMRLLDVFGPDGFSLHQAKVIYPEAGTKPEAFLESALTALAEGVL
ncbi:MAG: hypothetical protein LBT86_05945 [Deltaproteobacteria bacterium]|nr:hypothetical protein [Deltaproteobacteria bacterium]